MLAKILLKPKMMKHIFLFLFTLSCCNSFSQSNKILKRKSAAKKINLDSITWVKENPNWENKLFTDNEFINKIEVSKNDSIMSLYSSMRLEHRIFGYEKPNTNSKKNILLSVWTFDVEGNPSNCKYGSYYELRYSDVWQLKYVGEDQFFVKAEILKLGNKLDTIYIEKKWVE
jgi:hypothetical protein